MGFQVMAGTEQAGVGVCRGVWVGVGWVDVCVWVCLGGCVLVCV